MPMRPLDLSGAALAALVLLRIPGVMLLVCNIRVSRESESRKNMYITLSRIQACHYVACISDGAARDSYLQIICFRTPRFCRIKCLREAMRRTLIFVRCSVDRRKSIRQAAAELHQDCKLVVFCPAL